MSEVVVGWLDGWRFWGVEEMTDYRCFIRSEGAGPKLRQPGRKHPLFAQSNNRLGPVTQLDCCDSGRSTASSADGQPGCRVRM